MAPHQQDSIPTQAVIAPSFKIVEKAMELPIVNNAVNAATKLHTEAVAYPYVNQVETIIGGILTKAEDVITPRVPTSLTSTVTTTAAQLDTLACTGLDQVTTKVPALKLPTDELATATTDATRNLANTVLDFIVKFTFVRFVITFFVMVLGFVIKGMETLVGLLEGKAEIYPAVNTIIGVLKPGIGYVKAFEVLLEQVVEKNTATDLAEPVEKPKDE